MQCGASPRARAGRQNDKMRFREEMEHVCSVVFTLVTNLRQHSNEKLSCVWRSYFFYHINHPYPRVIAVS